MISTGHNNCNMDVVFQLEEIYDEYFSVIVHVGGTFKFRPMLDYVGGKIVNLKLNGSLNYDIGNIDDITT
ncbi:hypothetical protein Leryth_021204 [Lithospermum erythrorhizon]|nr:hypothetical protein Leryth_021204 [Lithospermum erythrorhizon]